MADEQSTKSSKSGAKFGHSVSEETRQKIRAALLGRKNKPCSEETKRKIGNANRGRQTALGRKLSDETKRKIGNGNRGKKHTPRKHTVETRRKQSEIAKARGKKHNFYVDGKGAERNGKRQAEMLSVEYKLWREAVFKRDDWTCQECGERGGRLQADHIKPWRDHPELRYEVDNGKTLCRRCHFKTPTYGGKMRRLVA